MESENTIRAEGDSESCTVTQSLRCYIFADFRLLIAGTSLILQEYEPYGDGFHFEKPVPLEVDAIF
jgi:hypothetical protein